MAREAASCRNRFKRLEYGVSGVGGIGVFRCGGVVREWGWDVVVCVAWLAVWVCPGAHRFCSVRVAALCPLTPSLVAWQIASCASCSLMAILPLALKEFVVR